MMLWLILIGILLIIYLVERLSMSINALVNSFKEIMSAVNNDIKKPQSTDDWAGK